MERSSRYLKPSEILNAFTIGKAQAARHAQPRIIEFVNAEFHTSNVTSTVPIDKPLFEPTPSEVWIDEYTPFQPMQVKLSFRNCDTVARRMKIESPMSPFFRIKPYETTRSSKTDETRAGAKKIGKSSGKVAAGMDIHFMLEFSPQEIRELNLELVCVTEREKFALPIRVKGKCAALDIPDNISFGLCPVKMKTSKVISVRNIGTRAAKFTFHPSEYLTATPNMVELAPSCAVQLEFTFCPPNLACKSGVIEIMDDCGTKCTVMCSGNVTNVGVYLSQPLVEPKDAYITLTTRKAVQLCNESDIPLEFVWKAFPDTISEENERKRLLNELLQLEKAEYAELGIMYPIGVNVECELQEDFSIGSSFHVKKALETKYKQLRKAVNDDSMEFVHESFFITPLTSRVWAHSTIDTVVSFSPQSAGLYTAVAFLEIGGQESRLPLTLRAQGIGPKAKVVYNEFLDFGEVYINDVRTRDATIQNKGEIPAVYTLLPLENSNNEDLENFASPVLTTVNPSCGTLKVNEMIKIEVTLHSKKLGQVHQLLRFGLQGSDNLLFIRVKAKIVPPIFRFDCDCLDFGALSYSFPRERIVRLINTSKIVCNYSLEIPEECNVRHKEFHINPTRGVLEAFGEQDISVHVTSINVTVYEYKLVVFVDSIEEPLLVLPIKAQCFVSDLQLITPELNFGTCFLRHPYKQQLILKNLSSHLHSRYEILEQEDQSKAIAAIKPSIFTGEIGPEGTAAVDVEISCEKVGSIRLPLAISNIGSMNLPLPVTLIANGTGPNVIIDPMEVNFGNVVCLLDHKRPITLTNASLINAHFKTLVRTARSKFSVDIKDGVLVPGEVLVLEVTANLDDSITFKDQLHIVIGEGENVTIPLTAKGAGTTMWTESELSCIDFSNQWTFNECEWRCTLENKGRRTQVLTWSNATLLKKVKIMEDKVRQGLVDTGSKKTINKRSTSGASISDNGVTDSSSDTTIVPVFSVFPGTIELKPLTACIFQFKGLSNIAGDIEEELVCETRVGKEKAGRIAFMTRIKAKFIDPILLPSQPLLSFTYIHDFTSDRTIQNPSEIIPKQCQNLSLTNSCAMPFSFTLRTQQPYSLDCWEGSLQPGEKFDVIVEFYPGYKDDYLCRTVNGKIYIIYAGHPKKDAIELYSDINFPNLSFETNIVDFGCILNETTKVQKLKITNCSKVDTAYQWLFVADDDEVLDNAGTTASKVSLNPTTIRKEREKASTSTNSSIPINQVFDILPIRGKLCPDESETVEFTYYGHTGRRFRAAVICEVEGGPDYELKVIGEASNISYKLDKPCLDFGQVLYNKTEDRDFFIQNMGKVPLQFSADLQSISPSRIVEVSPVSGQIGPGDKQRLIVRLRACIPEIFEENIILQIAHFEAVDFKLYGSGVFSSVYLSLPRDFNPTSLSIHPFIPWKDLKVQAREQLELKYRQLSQSLTSEKQSDKVGNTNFDTNSLSSFCSRSIQRSNSCLSNVPASTKSTGMREKGNRRLYPANNRTSQGLEDGVMTVTDLDVEIEATRIYFAMFLRHISQHNGAPLVSQTVQTEGNNSTYGNAVKNMKEDTPGIKQSDISSVKKSFTIKKKKSNSHQAQTSIDMSSSTTSITKNQSMPSVNSFVISQFLLDFGNVVVGVHKIRKFSVTNIGAFPISFQFDKNLAMAQGFAIEPERVLRLPEKQSVEFTVTFQARKSVTLKLHEVKLPIAIKNGPISLLTIRALVTTPDIEIVQDVLEFGQMALGTTHKIFTQIHNTSLVSVEWSLGKPVAGGGKDSTNFIIDPTSGNLAPGHKMNVGVTFTPTSGKYFTLKIPIKVASNCGKARSLTCRGEGRELRVSFSPSILELGPILPCSGVASQKVCMRNDSDYFIEIFSLDFDTQYTEDEQLLREIGKRTTQMYEIGSTEQTGLQLPLREPTQLFRNYLADNGIFPTEEQCKLSNIKTILSPDSLTHDIGSELYTAQADVNISKNSPTMSPTKKLGNNKAYYLILGPPMCGKSEQARYLAEKESLIVWTIDEAVMQLCLETNTDSETGNYVRRCLGINDALIKPQSMTKPIDIQQNIEGTEITEERPESNSSVEIVTSIVSPGEPKKSDIQNAILESMKWRLAQNDFQRAKGSILDGLGNSFLGYQETIHLCMQLFPTLRILMLNFDNASYNKMLAQKNDSSSRVVLGDSVVTSVGHAAINIYDHIDNIDNYNNAENNGKNLEDGQKKSEVVSSTDRIHLDTYEQHVEENNADQMGALEDCNKLMNCGKDIPSHHFRDSIVNSRWKQLQFIMQKNSTHCTFQHYLNATADFKQCLVNCIAIKNDQRALFVNVKNAGLVHNENNAIEEHNAQTAIPTALVGTNEASYQDNQCDDVPHSFQNTLSHDLAIGLGEYSVETIKKISRSKNFLMEVNVSESNIGGLALHHALYTSMDKFIKELDAMHLDIPKPQKFQIIKKPIQRFTRKTVTKFSLVNPHARQDANYRGHIMPAVNQHVYIQSCNIDGSKDLEHPDSDVEQDEHNIEGSKNTEISNVHMPITATRWILGPNETTEINIQFKSNDIGTFDSSLGFEIVGTHQESNLFCRGVCAVPNINRDPRNLFMHRIKYVPKGSYASKKFVLSNNHFDFGSLIVPPSTEEVEVPTTPDQFVSLVKLKSPQIDSFRITNISKQTIQLTISLMEVDVKRNEKFTHTVYSIFPPNLTIPESETREIIVFANPRSDGRHNISLVICIQDNPDPFVIHVTCLGVTPRLELRGPWESKESNYSDVGEIVQETLRAEESTTPSHSTKHNSIHGEESLQAGNSSQSVHAKHNTTRMEAVEPYISIHSPPLLDFEQLLLMRQEQRTFYIENQCSISVTWRIQTNINGEPVVPDDFYIFPLEGALSGNQKNPVTVIFTAAKEIMHTFLLKIEYSDAESALQKPSRIQSIFLEIKAEAYTIDVVSFESANEFGENAAELQESKVNKNSKITKGKSTASSSVGNTLARSRPSSAVCGSGGDGTLDFGLVRVGANHTKKFTIRNQGKYAIKFVFSILGSTALDLFTLDPNEMILSPGIMQTVTVTFHSKREVILKDCKDIKCTIIEMLSGDMAKEFYVLTTVRAVFSKFRIQPNKGINFGPMKFSDPPKIRSVEIRNEGEFPFAFCVHQLKDRLDDDNIKESLRQSLTMDSNLKPSTLAFSRFSVTPNCGFIDPGMSTILEIQFKPSDNQVYREMMEIEVSGRDEQNSIENDLLVYELAGESCFPAIQTLDFESIFEEQIVVYSIGNEKCVQPEYMPFLNQTNFQTVIFSTQDKLFSFGAILANAGSVSTSPTRSLANGHLNSSLGNSTNGISNVRGTVERIRISNPTKVSTIVSFSIKPTDIADTSSIANAFIVQPISMDIPAMEYRFVNLHFKPSVIGTYRAKFVATVEGSPSSQSDKDKILAFDLLGEGTLPCVSILEPKQNNLPSIAVPEIRTFNLALDFGRVRVSKRKELPLIIRNDGILPATVVFSMQPNPNFSFVLGNGSLLIAPKEIHELIVGFKPLKVSEENAEICTTLRINVHFNPFDQTTIQFKGEVYKDDICFADLPLGYDDELHFDDICLHDNAQDEQSDENGFDSLTGVKVFSICNMTDDIIRFQWPGNSQPFAFTPDTGHLLPGAHKLITARFTPKNATSSSARTVEKNGDTVVYQNHLVMLESKRISYVSDHDKVQTENWDSTTRTIIFDLDKVTNEASSLCQSEELVPEPNFTTLGGSSSIQLRCFAAADYVSMVCDTKLLMFKNTFMLQTRSHTIVVQNPSAIALPFKIAWKLNNQLSPVKLSSITSTSPNTQDIECPFEVLPETGKIPPKSKQEFKVNFAPLEADTFAYVLYIFSTNSVQGEISPLSFCEPESSNDYQESQAKTAFIRIDVSGSSLRPACHFDLEQSNYLQRRPANRPGPSGDIGSLDASIKVIEMESLGVRIRNTKRFFVINPTNVSYEFSWTAESTINPNFRCVTPKGLMLAGKRCEMIFEFTPQQLELQEMFWRFRVDYFQVDQLFLFVGTTTEPRVMLERGSINFNTLLIGTKTTLPTYIVNKEHIPFQFAFDKSILDLGSESFPPLIVHPLSGVIPPNSRTQIDLSFVPTEEKLYNMNLTCIIKRKPTRLSLNVKGEGYSIHDQVDLLSEDSKLNKIAVGIVNILDFGAVRINEHAQRTVVIHNGGKFNFEFNWALPTNSQFYSGAPCLKIDPWHGTVKKNDKITCCLTFTPNSNKNFTMGVSEQGSSPTGKNKMHPSNLKLMSLDGMPLTCTIAGSRIYNFSLCGTAVPPSVQFSFTTYDFGYCFIADYEIPPISETATLSIFNMDATSGIDMDCLYENKAYCRVLCPPKILGPRESLQIPIVFTPRCEQTYFELIPFTFNGSSTVTISIAGQGIIPKVELLNPAMQTLAFGSLQVGQHAVRVLKLVNRCQKLVNIDVVEPDDDRALLEKRGISIYPQKDIAVKPKEATQIDIHFRPMQRLDKFEQALYLRIAGSKKKLTTLVGSCQGMEAALEVECLSFGAVCIGSHLIRKTRLINSGDGMVKFRWNVADFLPDFKISPSEGVVPPNQHKVLEITFEPTKINPDIRLDRLVGIIEGTDSIYLTLVGSCVEQATSSIKEIYFNSRVREVTKQTLTIENPTKLPWHLVPVVHGEHWTCQESIAVPAEGKANLDIVYCPLIMTRNEGSTEENKPLKHDGYAFFALPNGDALKYNFIGKASPPDVECRLDFSTPAKKALSIDIPIKNWLKYPQTFQMEIITPAGIENEKFTLIQGPPSLSIASGVSRTYHLRFFRFTEGESKFTVKFISQENLEYLLYDVFVQVGKAAIVETLPFDAPVRQSVKRTIAIENPFYTRDKSQTQAAITFSDPKNWWKCTQPTIRVRELYAMSNRVEGLYEIEYRPLLYDQHSTTPLEATLTISFVELGEYTYKLLLSTQPAGIEQLLKFKAPLGSSEVLRFQFTVYSITNAQVSNELSCSVSQSNAFSVPSSCKLDSKIDWEGQIASVSVKFEPQALGEVQDVLVLNNPILGEYKCALIGLATPPLPQGPFVFPGTSSKDIEFKNVFDVTKDFELSLDNPQFALKEMKLTIPPKASKILNVKVANPSASNSTLGSKSSSSIIAKLCIRCTSSPEIPPWIFYLEAINDSVDEKAKR